MRGPRWLLPLAALAAGALGCGGDGSDDAAAAGGGSPPSGQIPYDTLGEYGFFTGNMVDHVGRPGVVPYDVNGVLWADNATKERFVVLPEGQTLGWTEREDWQVPLGTIVIKAFFFPEDLRVAGGPRRAIETRLLILEDEGWTSHTYVWNDAQTEAVREIAGKRVPVSYLGLDGEARSQDYLVPNENQCKGCHARDDRTELLGLITPQVNRVVSRDGADVEQLDWMAAQGMFASAPNPAALARFADPFGEGPLDARARAYLGANCAHCHRPGGGGGDSGLVLLEWETNPSKNGVCKQPAAAGAGTGGRSHDIVPGHPEQSIMPFRMASTDPEIKMPELPNLLPDEQGVALISEWIAAMTPEGCP
jgi:uncharacterized repeat protein (TIGR03806 family)